MQEFDIIIIGGSANGGQAALSAINKGVSVAVIEEHKKIGLPEHCSGLFSYWGLNELRDLRVNYNAPIFNSKIEDVQVNYYIDKILNLPTLNYNKKVIDENIGKLILGIAIAIQKTMDKVSKPPVLKDWYKLDKNKRLEMGFRKDVDKKGSYYRTQIRKSIIRNENKMFLCLHILFSNCFWT